MASPRSASRAPRRPDRRSAPPPPGADRARHAPSGRPPPSAPAAARATWRGSRARRSPVLQRLGDPRLLLARRHLARLDLLRPLRIEEGGRFVGGHLASLARARLGGLLLLLSRLTLLSGLLLLLLVAVLCRVGFRLLSLAVLLLLLLLLSGLLLLVTLAILLLTFLLLLLLVLLLLLSLLLVLLLPAVLLILVLLLLILLLLLLLLLVLLLLLELLLQGRDLLLDQLVVELGVDVVRIHPERAAIGGERLRPQRQGLLGLRRFHRLALAELRVADVVREPCGPPRLVVARDHARERRQGIIVLAALVARIAEIEVQAGRVGVVDQRLVVALDRLVVLPGVVQAIALPGFRVRIEPAHRQARQDGRGRRPAPAAPAATAAALPEQRLGDEQQEGERQRQLVAQLEALLQRALELALVECGDVVAIELGQAQAGARGLEVYAAGLDGDALQGVAVEARLHHLPLAILQETALLARDEVALRRADPDREDADAALLRPGNGGIEIALVALAVGDQHDRLMARLAPLEGVEAGVDRSGQRGATARDDADLDRVEALEERAGIEGKRTLQERRAREGHQREPIAASLVDQVADGELGARQAVRLHVGGEHAARRVECDHEVDALPLHLLPAEAPHGAGQGQDHERRRGDEQARPQRPPARIDVGRHGRLQRRRHELGQCT